MARPKKHTGECFTTVIPPIRCTADEKAIIQRRAARAGLSVSAYIRRMALFGEIIVQESRHDFQAIDQLRRIGVNLNQLTKLANSTGEVSPALHTVFSKLDTLLDQFIETH